MPAITIRTLGDMIDHGMYLTAHCKEQIGPGRWCSHQVRLDMNMLIEKLGRDFVADGHTLPPLLKCGVCGSKNVGIQLSHTSTATQRRAPDSPVGSVSAEYLAEMRSRENSRRKGRKNRLPEKYRAAIMDGAKNLGKPDDV